MRKILLLIGIILMSSCAKENSGIDAIKLDLKSSDKLSDQEIENTSFSTTKMLSSDGKKALVDLSLNRKNIVATKGGLFASALDVCNDSEIKENSDVYYIEAYRIAKDTVFKKIYFTNENKIVGKFKLK